VPDNGTTAQAILLNACRGFSGLGDLRELLQWLDEVAPENIRKEFDVMLEWPLVQDLGAFVQGAWVAVHERTKDWEPWLSLFERVDEYARQRASPCLGRQAAKAKAIILTEYLSRVEDALVVLEQAEIVFGPSPVLMEQRANVLFRKNDDESVLEIWQKLTGDPGSRIALNPFVYQRAGMSAARLGQWSKAGQIFHEGAQSVQPGFLKKTKFGLQVDAALAVSLGGDQVSAARLLAGAVLSLPAEAAVEDDSRWEALQRAAASVRNTIGNSLWNPTEAKPPFEPGYASSPELKVSRVEPGQAMRSELTRAQVLHLAATLATDPSGLMKDLELLEGSSCLFVRWLAAEARLALAFSTGAGAGFVEALVAFDKAMAEFSDRIQQGLSPLDPDDEPRSSLPIAPELWFGMLCAGAVCTAPNLINHLKIWLDASCRLLGEKAALTNSIQLMLKGASLPVELLQPAVVDAESPAHVRCGAAARLLHRVLSVEKTLQIQALLISGFVSDNSRERQTLFNWHVARHFANSWRMLAQSPFQFYSPRTSVPALLDTLIALDRGSGTLKSVVVAAATALRQPLGAFMERVL
jgi:hypothetical protein